MICTTSLIDVASLDVVVDEIASARCLRRINLLLECDKMTASNSTSNLLDTDSVNSASTDTANLDDLINSQYCFPLDMAFCQDSCCVGDPEEFVECG
jgi:hypothetical protein